MKAAYRRWGGGRTLPPSEVACFLDSLAALQAAADRVLEAVLPQIDPGSCAAT